MICNGYFVYIILCINYLATYISHEHFTPEISLILTPLSFPSPLMSFTQSLCRIFSLRLSQYRQYVCFHGKSTFIRANKILPQSSQKKFVIVLVFSVSYGSFVYDPPPFSWIRDRDCQRQLWMVVAMWFLFTLCPSNCNIQYAYLN